MEHRLLRLPRPIAAVLVVLVTLVVSAPGALAQAATCSVDYSAPNQWPGGFTANVTIHNDTANVVDGWTLEWSFPDGQTIGDAWNATVNDAGPVASVSNAAWNGMIAAGGSVSFGFNGSWSDNNGAPTSFTLNGTTCGEDGGEPSEEPSEPSEEPTEPSEEPTGPPDNDWNPPADLARALEEVWQHVEDTYPVLYQFDNYGWDQVVRNGGHINYCIRWDSDDPVSADLRDRIEAKHAEQWSLWMDAMLDGGRGFSDWPYTEVPVNVVGWAVRERDTLQWTDDDVPVYVGDISEGAPQCSGGDHDMSLWLTEGFGGGHGGDWGQRIGSEYFVGALDSANVHILLHEMGHSFGLDDFYDWTPTGVDGFLMKAGTASEITEFDKWMFRDFWRHMKYRYDL